MPEASLAIIRRPDRPGIEAVRGTGVAADIVRHAHAKLIVGLCRAGGRRIASGGGVWDAGPGEGFVIPPGVAHACSPLGAGGHDYLVLAVAPALLAPARRVEAGPVWPRLWRDAVAAALLVRLVDALAAGRETVFSHLAALAEALDLCAGPLPPLHPATAAAKALVDAAADVPVTLAELAREAGVGPFRLERLFRRELGVSPGEYVLSRRVALAAARIDAGQPLAEAALAAGFYDQSHLCRHFRRRMGVSPGRYHATGTGEAEQASAWSDRKKA